MEIKIRDAKAREEEAQGKLHTRIVINDNSQENLTYLLNLKRIFSNQLPKMPREYITRLVFDKKHKAVCVTRRFVFFDLHCVFHDWWSVLE